MIAPLVSEQGAAGEVAIMNTESSDHVLEVQKGNGPRPGLQEDTIKTEKIQVERKIFLFCLKENPRGRFLRITEDVNGRRDTIIVPASGLADFKKVLEQMMAEPVNKPA